MSESTVRSRLASTALAALAFLATASGLSEDKTAPPQPPRIALASPLALKSGATTRVLLRGWKLDEVQEVRCQFEGITTKLVEKGKAVVPGGQDAKQIGDTQAVLEIAVPAALSIAGRVDIVAVSAAGESEPHGLLLGALSAVVPEKEPNDGFGDAQAIESSQTIDGTLHADRNVDVFAFAVETGQTITAEVHARRHGSGLDSLLTLFDADGHILKSVDDGRARGDTDSLLEFRAPRGGRFFLSLQDAHDHGGPAHPYRLVVHVRTDVREVDKRYPEPIDLVVPHISTDKSLRYDFPIVYVRVPRRGDDVVSKWPEIAHPVEFDPGGDLMLLMPDGREEVLVAAGGTSGGSGSVTDPVVSLDGEWVFYSHIHDMAVNSAGKFPRGGADIFKIHLETRRIVRLTEQRFTPNTGAADWSGDFVTKEEGKTWIDYGVFNMGPYPLPAGRIVFTSNRDAFRPPKHDGPTLQLFTMDDDGRNVECIGHLNIGMALHPVVLRDGRIVFSSLESQGLRIPILWGLWSINPDGTGWAPVISAFDTGNAFHFQAQLTDGSIIAEQYYNQNNSGFGAYFRLPAKPAEGYSAFGPGWRGDERNPPLRFGRFFNSKPKLYLLPFSPNGIESFTRFANNAEGPADYARLEDRRSAAVGKFTHPSAAPNNHLLTVYTPGPANHQGGLKVPAVDGGIYLIKDGRPIDEPAEMRLIKNDPRYNEQYPRAVVSYERIYGVKEPRAILPLANDGSLSPHLPEGTPFGLVGSSSLYKRESYPEGAVPEGSVTASFRGKRDSNGYRGLDPFNTSQNGASPNWFNQGSDAGIYDNDDVHAVRILAMEPTTDRHRGPMSGRLFRSHAMERLRILGEIPVRKFGGEKSGEDGRQVSDPDGNPDTSFLAKIPADTAFTFQTLDKNGMALNMAQTWHQLRPGEIRTDCGGCHAHSQKPTEFALTAAAKPDYEIVDLTEKTPLLTNKTNDTSKRRWDAEDTSGLKIADAGVVNVEYWRDVRPILDRSCVACHSSRGGKTPAAKLDLDADDEIVNVPHDGKYPGTYFRLAVDKQAKFGHKPVIHNGSWRQTNASRYIRQFQSRRSLLIWKVWGKRLDGWSDDEFPTARVPGDANTLELAGKPIENTQRNRDRSDLDFRGKSMPPPAAVSAGKVKALTDEDRRTLVRWVDLGCPIDLDHDPKEPERRGFGWMCDDKRPTLTMPVPARGVAKEFDRILIGMFDYYSGLEASSLEVVADFPVDGVAAGENIAARFQKKTPWIRELKLAQPISSLEKGTLRVRVSDRQGNRAEIVRTFSVK